MLFKKDCTQFFEDRRSKRVTNDSEGKTVTRAVRQHKGIQHRSPDESTVCCFSGCFIKSSIKPCFGAPRLVKLIKKSIKLMLQLTEVAMWVGCDWQVLKRWHNMQHQPQTYTVLNICMNLLLVIFNVLKSLLRFFQNVFI